ncbi:MAG: hypothetical protein QOI21_1509 [Actinomycetota bacterium]|jgi:hypothetical protein|nr:hypothetical protein [Actinomycetota bacterium]
MATTSGAGVPRYTAYGTVSEYNAGHPDAPMPPSVNARNVLRSYTCAGAGLEDDLTASEKSHTLDFLPGGAPGPGELDRIGTVVATRWGSGPYLVLAEQVSLRGAWKAITGRWPADLSTAADVLRSLADASSPGSGIAD